MQIQSQNNLGWVDALSVDLSPYLGKTIYVVFRETDNQLNFDLGAAPWLYCFLACLYLRPCVLLSS